MLLCFYYYTRILFHLELLNTIARVIKQTVANYVKPINYLDIRFGRLTVEQNAIYTSGVETRSF